MLSDENRSFGHWRNASQKRDPKPDASKDNAARTADAKPADPMHDNLETIAGRRQRRDRLVEAPLPPGPSEPTPMRETLRRLAERKLKGAESGDLTEPVWDRVVELAKPIINGPPAATPPRSPAPRPNGRQRRTPER